jgi:hypothetical protein
MPKKEEENIPTPVPAVTYTAQEFANAYQELITKMKFRVIAIPSFLSRDDGTFSVVIQYQVAPL